MRRRIHLCTRLRLRHQRAAPAARLRGMSDARFGAVSPTCFRKWMRWPVKQLAVCVVGALASLTGMPLLASTTCQVRIDQIQGVKREFQVSFEPRLPDARMAQRRHFDLPDGDGRCTLAFFGKGSGASLSCELDPAGVTYVQSDRTTIKEYPARNELTFRLSRVSTPTRDRGVHYTVVSECR